MGSTQAQRVYDEHNNCCNHAPPRWVTITPSSMSLTDDETKAARAILAYGGTHVAGRAATWVTENFYGERSSRLAGAVSDTYGAPFDRSLPRLHTPADLPDTTFLFDYPEGAGQRHRQDAKAVTTLRIVYNETTGQHEPLILWCEKCVATESEQNWDNFVETFNVMKPIIHGIALACSYIPVFGTVVSFILNGALALADGEPIDDAALDAIGGALPGQPMAAVAFSATRSIIAGKRLDDTAVDALLAATPVDPNLKKEVRIGIIAAANLAAAIAEKRDIKDATLNEIYAQLPPGGKRAMSIARALANGERVSDVAIREVGGDSYDAARHAAGAAVAQGTDALNGFILQSGFQGTLAGLPASIADDITRAVKAGVMAGQMSGQVFVPQATFTNKPTPAAQATADAYAGKGLLLIEEGAVLASGNNVRKLSDIRAASSWAGVLPVFDAMSGTSSNCMVQMTIDDPWRYGFDVAIGLCEGLSADGLAQQQIRASLVLLHVQRGFDVGQAIQFERTRGSMVIHSVAKSLFNSSAAHALGLIDPKASVPVAVAKTVAPATNPEVQKRIDRVKWVFYYKQLQGQSV